MDGLRQNRNRSCEVQRSESKGPTSEALYRILASWDEASTVFDNVVSDE